MLSRLDQWIREHLTSGPTDDLGRKMLSHLDQRIREHLTSGTVDDLGREAAQPPGPLQRKSCVGPLV